ncbi:Plant lipid transfer protein/Par allergen [Sesbania bispinosa]|nr:Plant lipid transfer protein/Par allergen [Sesbania bispinosa]
MKMKQQLTWLCFFVLIVVSGGEDFAKKCSEVVSQVIPCLDFAQGKAAQPKKECCDAATKIKESSPECLCYIIQQTHKGSDQSKSLGIQEGKLLQLPTACAVKNASISNCPKLLGLAPNSPDAAIFTNASKVTPTPAGKQTPSTPLSQNAGSFGSMVRPCMIIDVMVMGLAIVLIGFVSI